MAPALFINTNNLYLYNYNNFPVYISCKRLGLVGSRVTTCAHCHVAELHRTPIDLEVLCDWLFIIRLLDALDCDLT